MNMEKALVSSDISGRKRENALKRPRTYTRGLQILNGYEMTSLGRTPWIISVFLF